MEILNLGDQTSFSTSFNSIKSLFPQTEHNSLQTSFQSSIQNLFSNLNKTDRLKIVRSKLALWQKILEPLELFLLSLSPDAGSALKSILSKIFAFSESAVEDWEKDLLLYEQVKVRICLENESLKEQLQKTQDELTNAMEMMERENKMFLHKIISLSKQTAESSLPQSPMKVVRKEITPKIPNNTILMNNRIAQGRELGFKQLKETIEEVYSTKIKFDEKCKENKQPLETMDQFMFTYLNQKFGLKTIITEWTFAIMKAVSRYENEDAEVKLFSKIIKHQINEQFRFVLAKVKEKIKGLLKTCLLNNSAYVRESQVINKLKEKMQGRLEEKEWSSIIVAMYSEEEAVHMANYIKEQFYKKQTSPSKGKVNQEDITFNDLQNVILNYDLSSHETLLTPFYSIFHSFDTDTDGIISHSEFRGLCEELKCNDDTIKLIEKIDPFDLGKINYSTCVQLFSELKTSDLPDNMSILHYLYFSKQSTE